MRNKAKNTGNTSGSSTVSAPRSALRAPRWLALALAGGFTLLFVWQGARFIAANAQTYDEAAHLAAGYSYWATGDFRLNVEDPPLMKLLWALPIYLFEPVPFQPDPDHWKTADEWLIGMHFLYDSPVPYDRLLTVARWVNLFLGMLLLVLIGWWGYRLWGPFAGLTALALAALDPNLLAHTCVLSTDLGLTLFTLLTFYLLWEYVSAPSTLRLTLVGVALGLALASKFSAIVVLASLVAVVGLYLLAGGVFAMPAQVSEGAGKPLRSRIGLAVAPLERIVLFALLTLLPAYFFVEFFTWGKGLKQQLVRHVVAEPSFYFLGEVSSRGWLTYFPFVMLVKTPLGTLALIALSLIGYRLGKPLTRKEAIFVVAPAALFFAAMALARVDIGVRVILPVYPFLFLLAGRIATFGMRNEKTSLPSGSRLNEERSSNPQSAIRIPQFLLLVVALGATAVSSLRVGPHQLAYFNELIGGPEQGFRYLGDSNLDWGQDLKGLRDYVQREGLPIIYLSYYGTAPPNKYGISYQFMPSAGYLTIPPEEAVVPSNAPRHVFALSVGNLQGTYLKDPNLYRWLWDRPPTATIGHSIRIYDFTDDPEALARLRAIAGDAR